LGFFNRLLKHCSYSRRYLQDALFGTAASASAATLVWAVVPVLPIRPTRQTSRSCSPSRGTRVSTSLPESVPSATSTAVASLPAQFFARPTRSVCIVFHSSQRAMHVTHRGTNSNATGTPNHALRTAAAVTLAAPPPSPAQPSRQPPPSLSLGSLGDSPRLP
jgi:hypothetical protein